MGSSQWDLEALEAQVVHVGPIHIHRHHEERLNDMHAAGMSIRACWFKERLAVNKGMCFNMNTSRIHAKTWVWSLRRA